MFPKQGNDTRVIATTEPFGHKYLQPIWPVALRRWLTSVMTPKNWTPMIVHVQSVQERGSTVTKRRTFKPDFKARVVLEELSGVKSTAEICRDHQLKPQVFSRWKAELLGRASEIFATRPSRGDEQERIAELERMVGRLTMELEAAKKVSNILTSHLSRNDR